VLHSCRPNWGTLPAAKVWFKSCQKCNKVSTFCYRNRPNAENLRNVYYLQQLSNPTTNYPFSTTYGPTTTHWRSSGSVRWGSALNQPLSRLSRVARQLNGFQRVCTHTRLNETLIITDNITYNVYCTWRQNRRMRWYGTWMQSNRLE